MEKAAISCVDISNKNTAEEKIAHLKTTLNSHQKQLGAARNEITKQQQIIASKEQELLLLREKYSLLLHQRFGPKTEKDSRQADLFDEAEERVDAEARQEESTTVVSHTRQRGKRQPLPDTLPRIDIVHALPAEEQICPHDGSVLEVIGEQTHEHLDIEPMKVYVVRHIQKKYACPCCQQHLVTARKPAQLLEKSNASAGLLAHLVIQKYINHLPLYRQSQGFKRLGINLPDNTLARWMIKSGLKIQPLINLIQEHLHSQPYLHVDETPLQVLKEADRKAQSKSFMWVQCSGVEQTQQAVLYHYAASRSGRAAKALLSTYPGAIVTDGYAGYNALEHEHMGCWAHARRKFKDAARLIKKGKTGKAHWFVNEIQKLYRIEKNSKGQPPDQRHSIRQQQAPPLLDKIKKALDASLLTVVPKSKLGEALCYLKNQWPTLIVYLNDGCYPIDNNPVERAIRPFALGRKNWIFSATPQGAQSSANLYSLVASAKLNGVEPYAYLRHVFTKLPLAKTVEDIEALLPWNYTPLK